MASEGAWNDLYNGVAELLGHERAETLMSHLLRNDESQLAMKSDIVAMKSDITDLRSEITALRSYIAGLKNNLITGLIVIVAAMIGILFAVL